MAKIDKSKMNSGEKGILKNTKKENLGSLCIENPKLSPYFKVGLQAIKNENRDKIKFPNTRKIDGSIDFDEALKNDYPDANRWDYGIEYDSNLIFIEVHPAQTSEVDNIIKKAQFIKEWLKNNCSKILNLPKFERGDRQFYWVASGGNGILATSRQAKRLAINHIKPVGTIFDYTKMNTTPQKW